MEERIREKALQLGYEDCGIIKIGALGGYLEKLEERISRIPRGEEIYGRYRSYADPSVDHPEIKSIIVAIAPLYRYNVPAGFDGVYGKYFMFDSRTDEKAPFFGIHKEFSAFLEGLGLTCRYVITAPGMGTIKAPARWAAYQAGLGIIRRNNCFYTANGSYNFIEMFAVDRELELFGQVKLKDCPERCGKCIEACPTRTLSAPYTMSMIECVTYQTSFLMDVPSFEMAEQIGGRVYGCDACQDACPFNKGKWTGGRDFPRIEALAPAMRPENIMAAGYDEIGRTIAPKYFYIKPENFWKWKLNALTFMMNSYSEKYKAPIKLGLEDPSERVRDFSRRVCSKLRIPF